MMAKDISEGYFLRKVQVARDASGNTLPMAQWDITYYIRDAQGNHLTTIGRKFIETDEYEATDELNIIETVMYGSDRLGTRTWYQSDDGQPASLIGRKAFTHSGVAESGEYTTITPFGSVELSEAPEGYFSSLEGAKHYELKNHLGNVLATVSDKRGVEVDGSNNVENYTAKVSDASFYYPFGSLMPGLSDFGGTHRFGFNGKEKDNEIHNSSGTSYDFGARIYNSRLGRWMSIDPLFGKYPSVSPYCYVNNMPITAVDKEGKEIIIVGSDEYRTAVLNSLIELSSSSKEGRRIYREMVASPHKIVIYYDGQNTNMNHGITSKEEGGEQIHEINFNPSDVAAFKIGSAHPTREVERKASVSLYHELRHSEQLVLGLRRGLLAQGVNKQGEKPIPLSEIDAVFGENIVRSQMGMARRERYDGTEVFNVSGVRAFSVYNYDSETGSSSYQFIKGDYSTQWKTLNTDKPSTAKWSTSSVNVRLREYTPKSNDKATTLSPNE